MAGSIVNQDGSLGYAYTMPGTEDVSSPVCLYLTDIYLVEHSFSWSVAMLMPMRLSATSKLTYSKYDPQVLLQVTLSYSVNLDSNQVSLACLTEAFNTDKSGKGKEKEQNHTGHDVVDLTSDNDDPVPDNGCEE